MQARETACAARSAIEIREDVGVVTEEEALHSLLEARDVTAMRTAVRTLVCLPSRASRGVTPLLAV
jgi:hypothetical protein